MQREETDDPPKPWESFLTCKDPSLELDSIEHKNEKAFGIIENLNQRSQFPLRRGAYAANTNARKCQNTKSIEPRRRRNIHEHGSGPSLVTSVIIVSHHGGPPQFPRSTSCKISSVH